ncbi:MAG TPA: MBL fold metallo-hydrolase [Candidatus Binatia bacterium]|nr:MBL fold metallo-hydrolase [Candidatus Binatia bacterium]
MTRRPEFREGLTQIANGVYAYLQPDGGLGLSNAGLVAPRSPAGGDGRGALLVDTFFDLPHTQRLLDAVAREVRTPIGRVLNTHYNGDHCWGNQLVRGAEIIGHRSVPADMAKVPPAALQALRDAPDTVPAARALRAGLARFDFSGIELTPPTTLLDERLTLDVGGTAVELMHVGPAHTTGDVIAYLPDDGIVFTGDVLFRLCAPIGWEGTFANWIAALERIAALDADTIVPGHGPVCGEEGPLEMRDYLAYVRAESRAHFDAGRSIAEAAAQIDLGPYAGWLESERIVFQIDRAYREFRGEPFDAPVDFVRLAGAMAELSQRH